MSVGSYSDILKRAREELSQQERLRLIAELAQTTQPANGVEGSERTLFDALNERGLIGFMVDGPGDLSTNPKHMEGFGKHGE